MGGTGTVDGSGRNRDLLKGAARGRDQLGSARAKLLGTQTAGQVVRMLGELADG